MKVMFDGELLNNSPVNDYTETYSTKEQIVGIWHDGRPVYRAVIIAPESGGYSSNTDGGAINLTKLPGITPISVSGYVHHLSDNKNEQYYMIPWLWTTGSIAHYSIEYNHTNGMIVLDYKSPMSTYFFVYAIIEYVKDEDLQEGES